MQASGSMSEALSSPSNVIEFPVWRLRTERNSELDVQRAVSEERLRIARELHDVVASSFATISVQAGVAVHVLEEQPAQAVEALKAIKSSSKEALGELRAILGMLRTAEDDEAQPSAPGLGRLDVLAARTTASGVTTQLRLVGRPRPLPAVVDLTAFRIVQESLANVVRHAGAASAVVTISYERDGLIVEVEDDGCGETRSNGEPSEGSGNGIVGMCERVLAVGGDFEAKPLPERGFRVRARLPVLGRS
jgi:signal transduction histidine kinase